MAIIQGSGAGASYKVPTLKSSRVPKPITPPLNSRTSGRGGAAIDYSRLSAPVLTRGQTADAARYTAQAISSGNLPNRLSPQVAAAMGPVALANKTGLTKGQIGDAARYTAQAISYNQFPNLMSPQVASAMGLSEADRTALGYDTNWPYTRKDPVAALGVSGLGGSVGGGGSSRGGALRAGGGQPAVDYFGGGNIGLVNWRI